MEAELTRIVSGLSESVKTIAERTLALTEDNREGNAEMAAVCEVLNDVCERVDRLEALLAGYAREKGDEALLAQVDNRRAHQQVKAKSRRRPRAGGGPDVIPFPG